MKTIFVRLNNCKLNHEYKIIKVSAKDDFLLRRFMDLGLVEGTKIKALHNDPSKNLTAYLIRGAVIALRNDDIKDIIVYEI